MTCSRRIRRLATMTVASALTLGLAACASNDVGSGSDYATDSFSQPTEHGELRFGTPNPAEFTDDNRFHSWTFSLSADAEIDLSTTVTPTNLDTVMYLYQRSEDGWGSYIDKNDDYDGLLTSRITRALGAGEYRIKVKATKVAMRGPFAVLGQCTGEGCPTSGGGTCNGDGPANLPTATGYTPACDAAFAAILTSPTGATPPECAQALEERAVQYYKDYWDEIYGYDELTGGEEVEPYVDIQFHPGAGTVVDVGLGGDEDSMDFVFDAHGKLLFYYQHNQSPDWAWFCAAEGEPTAEEPDEDCVTAAVSHSDYDVEDVADGSGSTPAGETSDAPPQVAAAFAEYVAIEGVSPGAPVDYAYQVWQGYYTHGADVSLSAEGHADVTYVVTGDPEWGMTIVFRSDQAGTSFVCKEL